MKLTTFTDYSLRVLMYLATQPQRRATIAEIAAVFDVSEHHLTKVVHFLGKHGWLANVRGRGGGLELGQPPESIVVGTVVRATEGDAVVVECFETGGRCTIGHCCRLSGVLAGAIEAFYAELDRHTMAEMVGNRQQLTRALFPQGVRIGRPATRQQRDG